MYSFCQFSLLLVIGTIIGNSDAKCAAMITPVPTMLTFTVITSPSAAQTYVLTSTFSHPVTVTINPSINTQVTLAIDQPYIPYPGVIHVDIPAGGTQTVYVEAVASAPIGNLNEYVENSWMGDDHATIGYPVQIRGTAPLPIQLVSFSATLRANNAMQLDWTTASEVNNYGFYAQKSCDKTNWENVGELIRGHGTTLEPQKYSATLPISNGSRWVRLKQVDLDGTFTTSEARCIEVMSPVKFNLKQNYPNPFNPSTRISFATTKEGPVSLRVYDVLGREVGTLVNENRKAGQYTEEFNGAQAASGMYIYVLRTSEGRLTGRMLMMK